MPKPKWNLNAIYISERLQESLRPISQSTDLAQLYARRKPLYERFADCTVSNDGTLQDTLNTIKEALK